MGGCSLESIRVLWSQPSQITARTPCITDATVNTWNVDGAKLVVDRNMRKYLIVSFPFTGV